MYIMAGSNGTGEMLEFVFKAGIECHNLNYRRGQTALFAKAYDHFTATKLQC